LTGGIFLDKILKQSLLYDFYGEMLTPHQKLIYEDFVLNDLSLGEIAALQNISRQGVFDIIKRCDRKLRLYEEKLNLIEKFNHAKQRVEKISQCAKGIQDVCSGQCKIEEYVENILRITDEIIEDL